MATYLLPEAVRLQFDVNDGTGAVDHDPASALMTDLSAQWQRQFQFFDPGYVAGLTVTYGALAGQLTAVDLHFAAAYDHTFTSPSAATILPSEFTPVSAGVLQTVDIRIFFQALGTGGTALQTFKCLARPDQLSPQEIGDGIAATAVSLRWEIRDDTQP